MPHPDLIQRFAERGDFYRFYDEQGYPGYPHIPGVQELELVNEGPDDAVEEVFEGYELNPDEVLSI